MVDGHKQTEAATAATVKHGGAGALHAIQHDKEFSPLAEAALVEVQALARELGAVGMVRRTTERLQVVSDLYYGAIEKAAQEHDTAQMTKLIQVWGWITNSAARGWLELAKHEKKDDGSAAMAIIDQYRSDINTGGNQDAKE